MTTKILTDINSSGIFKLAIPYDALMPLNTTYTVKAVRKLADIIASGLDPYTEYYSPYGVGPPEYNQDLNNDVAIVSLCSGIGQWIYIPSSKIISYPNVNGVSYTALMMGVSLGAIPDNISLEPLKTSITNLVNDIIGVSCVIKEIAISNPAIISYDEHILIENARQTSISMHLSDRALLSKALSDYAAAKTKIIELENYIKTKLHPYSV